jgi:F0F1-type ATP synthase membrane subunit b/b'
MEKLIVPAIHLALLIGFIVYKVKTPFGEFMRSRHKTVSDGLNRSKNQAIEAQAKKAEVEAKLAKLDSEKLKIDTESKERQTLQSKAIQEGSQRLIAQMKKESEQNKKALESSLGAEVRKAMGTLILAQAEQKIRQGLNPETHKRVNDRFAGGL